MLVSNNGRCTSQRRVYLSFFFVRCTIIVCTSSSFQDNFSVEKGFPLGLCIAFKTYFDVVSQSSVMHTSDGNQSSVSIQEILKSPFGSKKIADGSHYIVSSMQSSSSKDSSMLSSSLKALRFQLSSIVI